MAAAMDTLSGAFDFTASKRDIQRAAASEAFQFYKSVRTWRHFLTLTFESETGPDPAWAKWRGLVKYLNKNLFGAHYTKAVGHSYFSYLLGIEYQKRGVIHFHVLVDRPIDYERVHAIWGKLAGFSWIERVKDDKHALLYVTKYLLKGGDVICYRSYSNLVPSSRPLWWTLGPDS